MSTSGKSSLALRSKQLDDAIAQSDEGAIFSPDRAHRYVLWRRWADHGPTVLFVGLNPSTADERTNDPTIRRCISFASQFGAATLIVSNLFAFRATKPKDLFCAADPVGLEADAWLEVSTNHAKNTVACWGTHGAFLGRASAVLPTLRNPHCFGTTMGGEPKHPLYLRGATKLVPLPGGRA